MCAMVFFYFSIKPKHHAIELVLRAWMPSRRENQLIVYHLTVFMLVIACKSKSFRREAENIRAPGQWFSQHCIANNRSCGFIYKTDARVELKCFEYVILDCTYMEYHIWHSRRMTKRDEKRAIRWNKRPLIPMDGKLNVQSACNLYSKNNERKKL